MVGGRVNGDGGLDSIWCAFQAHFFWGFGIRGHEPKGSMPPAMSCDALRASNGAITVSRWQVGSRGWVDGGCGVEGEMLLLHYLNLYEYD